MEEARIGTLVGSNSLRMDGPRSKLHISTLAT